MTPEERNRMQDETLDAELQSALKNFRMSVHAWSEAAYNRPRSVTAPTRTTMWRRATGWAMGCVLVLAAASGGVYEHNRHVAQEQQRAQQARVAEQQAEQKRAAAERAAEDEDALLTHVDSDISRQIPAAMDPLAGLADVESGTKQ